MRFTKEILESLSEETLLDLLNNEQVTGLKEMAENYSIVRTYSAGVFAGYIESREGKEVVVANARRLWRWSGAASLSQLAVDGTSNPGDCKFPVAVEKVILTEVIEIIPCTQKAKDSIGAVPIWTS